MPRILVADDSKVIQRVIHRLLTAAEFEVELVSNGDEALASLAKAQPDLIVSDVNMPGRTGYEICDFVRSQPGLLDTPILLISGVVTDEVARRAEACRADGILKKPFDDAVLKNRVLELLTRRGGHAMGKTAPLPTASLPRSAAASGPLVPPPTGSLIPEPSSAGSDRRPADPETAAPGGGDPSFSRLTEGALLAFRRTVANLKRVEAELAEERAQVALLTQQLAALGQDVKRQQQIETLRAQEQAKTAQLTRRLQETERLLAEQRGRADTMTRAMAEITRLAGDS